MFQGMVIWEVFARTSDWLGSVLRNEVEVVTDAVSTWLLDWIGNLLEVRLVVDIPVQNINVRYANYPTFAVRVFVKSMINKEVPSLLPLIAEE